MIPLWKSPVATRGAAIAIATRGAAIAVAIVWELALLGRGSHGSRCGHLAHLTDSSLRQGARHLKGTYKGDFVTYFF